MYSSGLTLACLNADGRPGIALFYRSRAPAVFFSRGFGCFGLARELVLSDSGDPVQAELAKGQVGGAVADFNADGVLDLLGVADGGQVAVLFGRSPQRRLLALTLAVPERSNGPITATAATDRPMGAVHLAPGRPVTIACAEEGPVHLTWRDAAGQPQSRTFEVLGTTRGVLAAGSAPTR